MVRSVSGLVQASARSPRVRGPAVTLLAVITTGTGWSPGLAAVVSRVIRAYELRATGIAFDETAAGFLREAVPSSVINVIANEPNERDEQEYRAKWREEREVNRIPEDEPTVFLEMSVADASEFEAEPRSAWPCGTSSGSSRTSTSTGPRAAR
jgi:hypothetical protein